MVPDGAPTALAVVMAGKPWFVQTEALDVEFMVILFTLAAVGQVEKALELTETLCNTNTQSNASKRTHTHNNSKRR